MVIKVSSGNLIDDELFLDDPTGTVVSIWNGSTEIKQITNKLIGIQKYKNATTNIISNNQQIPVTPEIWKTVYIINYSTPDNDNRLETLQKTYNVYNSLIKQDVSYCSRDLMQIIDNTVLLDLNNGKNELTYNISGFKL